MTHIEQAIREAVEKGGYDPERCLKTYENWKEKVNEVALLDPLFWQALGKARGWTCECELHEGHIPTPAGEDGTDVEWDGCPKHVRGNPLVWQPEWQFHWHRFVDHLAEGKDAESFFASLN